MSRRTSFERNADRRRMGDWYVEERQRQEDAMQRMDWQSLIFGSYTHEEIRVAIGDIRWQTLRMSLLGSTLEAKYALLKQFMDAPVGPPIEVRRIVVTNYVNALARGGFIPPTAERQKS